jgi:tRNA-specific 2-thiouridylase
MFVREALKLGADYVATGHYCRKWVHEIQGKQVYSLVAGKDPNKDQSYFLCQLTQKQLSNALFPVGELHKHEVRKIAEENDLVTAIRKDSQGICFVGKVDLPVFLQQKLSSRRGRIIEVSPEDSHILDKDLDFDPDNVTIEQLERLSSPYNFRANNGQKVGLHNGAHFFTIGQNKGLNIGGRPKPSFVVGIDTTSNLVFTGQGKNHPGLFRKGLKIAKNDVHWVRPDCELTAGQWFDYKVRIRYRQPLQDARLYMTDHALYVIFDKKQRSITAGQFAAWYNDQEELIGSGTIFA